MSASNSAAANTKPVAEALAKKKPVLDAALQNAFMAALPGENDDVELDEGDAEKLNKKIAELAAQLAQPDNAIPIRKNIENFGAPDPTDAPPNSNPAASHDPGSAADILSDDASEEVPPEARSAMGEPDQAEHAAPGAARPAPPAAANPDAAPQDPNQTGTPPAEDQGLQHCPTCGRIKNPDGTCPNGCEQPYNDADKKRKAQEAAGQTSAGDTGAAPTPTGADGTPRPQVDRTVPPDQGPNGSGAMTAPEQQKNQQEIQELNGKISNAKSGIEKAKKEFKNAKKKLLWINIISGTMTITVVLIPVAGIIKLASFYYHHKKNQAEKKMKQLEADIKKYENDKAKLEKKK